MLLITRQRSFAGILERTFDDFGQRIRTVLETIDGRVGGPEEMLVALGNQTLGRWELVSPDTTRSDPSACHRGRRLHAHDGRHAFRLFAGRGLAKGDGSRLGEWSVAYTDLRVTPGDTRLLEGTPVEVALELSWSNRP